MHPDPDSTPLTDYRDNVIHPLCIEFASRVGADEPQRIDLEDALGSRIDLPKNFTTRPGQSFTVMLIPFDEHAFSVEATRPDFGPELRRIGLVRYDNTENSPRFATEIAHIREQLDQAFEQVRQLISKERTQ